MKGDVALVNDERTESVVDLVLGNGYAGTRTPAEVSKLIAAPAAAGDCAVPG